jgi:hypothetical protein
MKRLDEDRIAFAMGAHRGEILQCDSSKCALGITFDTPSFTWDAMQEFECYYGDIKGFERGFDGLTGSGSYWRSGRRLAAVAGLLPPPKKNLDRYAECQAAFALGRISSTHGFRRLCAVIKLNELPTVRP